MRIISKRTLKEFWQSDQKYLDSKGQLEAWHSEMQKADWNTPQDVKAQFWHASIVKGSRVVFNICGNKYRPVVKINYPHKVIYVRFIGTHRQYDDIEVETI